MTPSGEVPEPRRLLRDCLDAAIGYVQPGTAMTRALAREARPHGDVAVLALGKAAPGMATALDIWFRASGTAALSGLIVGAAEAVPVGAQYAALIGGHPDPDAASAVAATGVGEFVAALPAACEVHVAISGGASALVAGPIAPVPEAELYDTFSILQRAGLGIDEMNAVRKRVTRWTAGRLALALYPRPVRLWLISDVVGDRPDVIGSGPCSGDPWTTAQVQDLIAQSGISAQLPANVRAALEVETPKPGDYRFDKVRTTIVASSGDAVAAAARFAVGQGFAVAVASEPLVGEAAAAGQLIASATIAAGTNSTIYCWGGETTVRRNARHGRGGRAQELALSAARAIRGTGATILASGTDGRDGPTDAAGALVDGTTWDRLLAMGADPDAALAAHDSYPVLERAGALIRTGPTGTNVMDLVLAFSGSA